MRKLIFYCGRGLQLAALAVMPLSMWITQFKHDEKAALTVFLGSIAAFFVGYLLTRMGTQL